MGNAHWGYGYGYGYGWNNYYGWNGWYNNNWGWRNQMNNYAWQHRNRPNTVYVNGRRGSVNNEIASNRRVRTSTRSNINTNTRPNNTRIVNENGNEVLILKDRKGKPVRFELNNNNTKPRGYGRPELNNNNNNNNNVIRTKPVIRNNNTRPSYNNTRPSNNVRPRINNNNNTRSTSTNVNRSTNSRGGSGVRKN